MFYPKTKKIEKLSAELEKYVKEVEALFVGNVNVYIDYANVRPWSNKLNWNIDVKRLKQF